MKLYLSSYRVPTPKDLIGLIGKEPKNIKAAFINNAKDYKPPAEYKEKLQEARDFFTNIDLEVSLVDLRDFSGPDKLLTELRQYDLIWGNGGNTFILIYEMKRSGFDKVIRQLLDEGKVYGGESAGAIVAGTSLRGIEWADDPSLAKEVIWDGLTLIDKAVVPHADSPDPVYTERMPKLLEQYKENPDSVVVLNDNEAWVVDNEVAHKVRNTS
ncbi:MAG: Type 1 glutamine amidotransferase-like domain-containing protein [Acidobacteriota bacterium]